MIRSRSYLAWASAATFAGAILLTGCNSTSDSVTESPSPMQSETEASDVNTDITPEQNAFVSDLLATPLPQDEATARIEEAGYVWRLGTIDGEPQAVTMDYRLDRLTLTTQDGLVIDATWG